MPRRCIAAACLAALVLTDWTFVQAPLPKVGATPRNYAKIAFPIAQKVEATAEASEEASTSIWRLALAACAALLVALVPLEGAEAARRGGRMGGIGGGMRGGMRSGMRSPGVAPRAAPRASSGPNINIGVGPMIAPPMFGPSIFAPPLFGPPVLPLPVPSFGPSFSDQMLQDQQRRDERQIDSQKSQIDALQKELADLKAKRQ
mmetsp:Transcript_32710/g.76045  ORF Transcript_32710/g.76045 Transcript_32710/m.76045 type:complete len:203 (+) Transcript_32710:82-690(+)